MRQKLSLVRVAGLVVPALALAAWTSGARAQCTGFGITSSTGAVIVPGTTDAGNHADDLQTLLTLPFAVNMYGTSYNTAQVSSNGNIQFTLAGTYTAAYSNECLAAPAQVTGVAIFPHWDDLMTNSGGIFTSVSGVEPNRIFNIEWRAGYYPSATVTLGFELRLFEDNSHFEVIYGTVPGAGGSATVGVRNATGLYDQFECNAGGLSSGLKLTFTPLNSATVLCGSGAAVPPAVNNCQGSSALFTVHVNPGTNPPSTGLAVTGNLSNVGGSPTQIFYDDGSHGDSASGDSTFSYLATIPASVTPGAKTINYSATDDQARSGTGTIILTVNCSTPPHPTLGPDVYTYDITDVPRWGTNAAGDVTAYSVGTTSSNGTTGVVATDSAGNYPVFWIDSSNYAPDYDQTQHPVISQNMYRLKSYGTYSRFEHLGQSWLKHGFVSTNSGANCLPSNIWRPSIQDYQNVGGDALGVNCTDTYGGSLNGSQGSLGAKNIVNAALGTSAFIRGNGNDPSPNTNERLQVPTVDVASQPVGTRFFVDAYYVAADDAQFVRPGQTVAFNALNNASWREITASSINSAPAFSNNTQIRNPGIIAWSIADPTVTLVTADHDDTPNPGTGWRDANGSPSFPGTTIRCRFWVGAKVTALGGGLYRYEYAVYNHNSDRSAGRFSVPMPSGAAVSNITFHAPMWHSGEPYSNAAWTTSQAGNMLTFATQDFAVNQNANALRWACLYNFGFTANVAPTTGAGTISLFKPGTAGAPGSINANGLPVPTLPPQCGSSDFNCDGDPGTDLDIETFWSCIAGTCPAAPCTSTGDFNFDGDVGTDADIEAFYRVLAGGNC